ncbi:MAG: hypothetical protein ACI8QC_003284 [Planctomycetota bacterium]|jgi:hypothetical protein
MVFAPSIALASLALLQSAPAKVAEVPVVTAENLAAIVAAVVPGEDELKWRSIPWRPTLFDGLQDGAEERRPVLLWAMNGHPLGTT